jgi:hypothetical protein
MGWESGEQIEVNEPRYPLAEDVNKWSRSGMGHDSINQWICVEVRAKRLGVYGHCSVCSGKGKIDNPVKHVQKMHDEWEEYEPPEGEGYQLWETTSEGSPISPVFDSAEALAKWCENGATIFGSQKVSQKDWLKMFLSDDKGEVGSLLMSDGNGYLGPVLNAPGADDE